MAIITMSQFNAGNCGTRVWIDLSTNAGRASYSLAMLAFSMGRTVTVRADDSDPRVFGECKLYDIAVN
ncbi:hypothetical protein [Roseateles sp. MS654]|uniref:hypothetical protein n=1 Tax=Roseateles sp. MS654 TaxID=3412685 RepID=UPI003C305439